MKARTRQADGARMKELILYLGDPATPPSAEEIALCLQLEASEQSRLPDSFFEVLGTWEDDREPEAILRDIRA